MTDRIEVNFTVRSGYNMKLHGAFETLEEAKANAVMASLQDQTKQFFICDNDGEKIASLEAGSYTGGKV